MWELTYLAPKGFRVNRYFVDVMMDFDNDGEIPWCYDVDEKWYLHNDDAPTNGGCSTHSSKKVRTIKAFKRYLKKHPELKGYKVRLCNKHYIRCDDSSTISLDVVAEWKER